MESHLKLGFVLFFLTHKDQSTGYLAVVVVKSK